MGADIARKLNYLLKVSCSTRIYGPMCLERIAMRLHTIHSQRAFMQSCENLSTQPLVEPPLSAISNRFLYDFINLSHHHGGILLHSFIRCCFDSFKFDICLVVCSDATVKTSVVLPCGVCS